jgi:hypothetical protein
VIYLLKDNITFLKNREEKIIPIMSLTTVNKIHITSVMIGDLIFDVHGDIATVIENISEKDCKIMVLTINENCNVNNVISSFR